MEQIEVRLVKLARAGDRTAFAELVELYRDRMYHLAYRMLGNRHEAEEIAQETFLRLFLNLDKYDYTQKFSTWLYRIATNLSIDRLRRRRSTYSLDADMSSDGEGADFHATLASEDPAPDEQVLLSDTQRRIREAIGKMPEKYKSIVVLRYLHDMSLQEISEVLDMPVTTIKTRVHRGREYLRNVLEEDFDAGNL